MMRSKALRLALLSSKIAQKRGLASFAKIDQVLVDSFASKAFTGNPAAVVFQQRDATWMQNVASENNTPVTAFLARLAGPNSPDNFKIRWFTPTKEIYLCGHATLAASHALYETQIVPKESAITFQSLYSGSMKATRSSSGAISMDFPATPPTAVELTEEQTLCIENAIGIERSDILYVGRTSLDLILELKRSAFSRVSAMVDYAAIHSLGDRGLVITCVGKRQVHGKDDYLCVSCGGHNFMNDANHDFLLRGFFPSIGLNEDAVTGSALCALAPYYHHKFHPNTDPNTSTEPVLLNSYQASQRGGRAQVALLPNVAASGEAGGEEGSEVSEGRVLISGHCVTVMQSVFM